MLCPRAIARLALKTPAPVRVTVTVRTLSSTTPFPRPPSTLQCHRYKTFTMTCPVRATNTFLRRLSTPSPPDPKRKKLQQKAENAKHVINKLKENIPTHENIYTIPNFLTFTRLLSAPVLGYLIIQQDYPWALGLFALSGLTDMLDGYIARRYNLKTVVGSIIDPAADKALMTVMTVTLAADGVLPMPVAALILGRDAGLVLAAFYYRYISLPAPKTLMRYFDFSIPSAEVRPTTISKINTALQLLLMGCSLTTTALGLPGQDVMTALHWTVGTTTVWSGLSYVFSKDAVRILTRNTKQ